jgi:quercetin dioxygenase-like cupin family protein
MRGFIFAALFAIALPLADAAAQDTAKDYPTASTLLTADHNIVGEKIAYPTAGPAKITSLIVTIDPGTETGWHKHGVPLYVYILSGEATVDYEGKGTRVYKAGDAFMEAMDVWHNGRNTGAAPVRILTVYMGADGADNVIRRK